MRCAAPPLIGASRCLLLLLSPLSVRRAHRDLAGSSPLAALHRGHGRDGCPCREPVITVAGYDPAWPGQCEVLRGEDAAAMAGAGVAVVAIGACREHIRSRSGGRARHRRWHRGFARPASRRRAASYCRRVPPGWGPGHRAAPGVQGTCGASGGQCLRDRGWLPATGPFAGGEVSRAGSRVR